MKTKKYAVGAYNPDGTKKTKTKPVKKRMRYNKTYNGSLTKRRRDINSRRAVAILAMWCMFATTYAFAMTSNPYTINGAVVKGIRPASELDAFVEQASEAVKVPTPASLPVMVETEEQENERKIREIAKEFDFKWENYLVNLACCEGLLKTDTINDKGNSPSWSIDRGLYGINNYWHSEVSDATAYDLRESTIWTINHINNGKQHEFICDKRIRGVNNFYLRCLN